LKNEYWENYYHREHPPLIPSQFAVFAMNEFPDVDCVVDIGCGNGRDSFFFAGQNKQVLAIDGSNAAIEACEQQRRHFNFPNLTFCNADISDLLDTAARFAGRADKTIMLYARFLVHALTMEQEEVLLTNVRSLLRRSTGVFAAEFRTLRDTALKKQTTPHFRRFVDPVQFLLRCQSYGLAPTYFTEGFGFAKFKDDDAHVARVILQLSGEASRDV
jgi:SAM-dependent methyltransferase